MLNTVEFYYFSPTGGTRKVGEYFCAGLAERVNAVNLAEKKVPQPVGDLVVVAAPVFGGRIPAFVTEKLRQLTGVGKNAVTLAVYGNRAYEDALLELNNIMRECGFAVIASAALLAQHSIVPALAAGRPDAKDLEEINDFAGSVLAKLGQMPTGMVEVPGNYPYKESKGVAAAPITTASCRSCGACANICPVGAVSIVDGQVETDLERCILCMACVAQCPAKARKLPQEIQEAMEHKLAAFKEICKKNEFFL